MFEFRNVCGGSRARAFAVTGNPFDEEPCCVYEPKAAAKAAGCKYTPSLIAADSNFSVGGVEPGLSPACADLKDVLALNTQGRPYKYYGFLKMPLRRPIKPDGCPSAGGLRVR